MIELNPTREELANEIKILREYIHKISDASHDYHVYGNTSKKKYIKKIGSILGDYYSNEKIGLDISELTHELFK